MVITSIKMNTDNIPEHSRIIANFSVVFDNCFVIHDIVLIKGKERNYISFYSRTNKSGERLNVCHPINKEFRNYIESTLIEYYNTEIKSLED